MTDEETKNLLMVKANIVIESGKTLEVAEIMLGPETTKGIAMMYKMNHQLTTALFKITKATDAEVYLALNDLRKTWNSLIVGMAASLVTDGWRSAPVKAKGDKENVGTVETVKPQLKLVENDEPREYYEEPYDEPYETGKSE